MIYFIQRESGGLIKIGMSTRLSLRQAQLQCELLDDDTKLRVLAVMDGGCEEEKALHERFSLLRVIGEWFEPGGEILDCIANEARPWDGVDEVPVILVYKADSRMAGPLREWVEDLSVSVGATEDEVLDMALKEFAAARKFGKAMPRRLVK